MVFICLKLLYTFLVLLLPSVALKIFQEHNFWGKVVGKYAVVITATGAIVSLIGAVWSI